MTPSGQTALVNGAEPAQAPPRTALHVVKPSSGADLAAAEQAAAAFLVALGVDLDTESFGGYPGSDGPRVRRDAQPTAFRFDHVPQRRRI